MTTTTMTRARARKGDPATSHEAAAGVDAGGQRARVYALLLEAGPEGLTHEQLIARHGRKHMTAGWPAASGQGIRSRCAELVRDGLVEAVPDKYGRTADGGRTRYWRAVSVQNNETIDKGAGR